MDSGMMGAIMMGMVIIGLGLSVYQLIAEVAARGRRAALNASESEVLRKLYSRQTGT